MRNLIAPLVSALLLASPSSWAAGDIISSYTSGTTASTTNFASGLYGGFSFNTGSKAADNLVMTIYSDATSMTPTAAGTGFLLTGNYTGQVSLLSPSTSGFIAEATASGSSWTFASNVTLAANTRYYFYENGLLPVVYYGTLAGETSYVSASSTSNYVGVGSTRTNFRLTGTPTSVPEASEWAMLGLILAGIAVRFAWSRRHSRAGRGVLVVASAPAMA